MDIERLVEKVLNFKGRGTRLFVEKYSKAYILSIIEERDEIQLIQRNLREYDVKGVDIIDFVRIFLNLIPHNDEETLYFTVGLIDLFKDICETFNLTNTIKSGDILNYIVEVGSFLLIFDTLEFFK
jgi:hypothetical protein